MLFGLAALSLALTSCTDKYDPDANLPPTIAIDSHVDGVSFQKDTTTVTAVVHDENNLPSEWTINWYLGSERFSGHRGCTGNLLRVVRRSMLRTYRRSTRPRGHRVRTLLFSVLETAPPTAEITRPTPEEQLYANYPIDFVGVVGDALTDLVTLGK